MTNPQDLRTIFAKAINKYVAKNLVVNPLRILEQIHIEGIADVCTALLSTPPDEDLVALVDEYLHWRKVNPHIKGGENYLKRMQAARATPAKPQGRE